MGGINHQPTSQVSLSFTVPGARALSSAVAELMLGNVAIEDVVLTNPSFMGVGRQHLIDALAHFDRVVTQLNSVKSFVSRVQDTLGSNEYNPFDLNTLDAEALVSGAIIAGMLPDDKNVITALETIKQQGYNGIFFEIGDRVDQAIALAKKLSEVVAPMIDGPEGTQGYFWQNVEANRNTFRQDFMRVLTALNGLVHFWTTTAVVCTEVHLTGVGAPSLLNEQSTVV